MWDRWQRYQQKQVVVLFRGVMLIELFDKSRGGDETRHKYLTYSEWHTDSKFVGLLKVGYQASILKILQTWYLCATQNVLGICDAFRLHHEIDLINPWIGIISTKMS